ncbi:MAG: hypothetical protein KBT34_09660 [Prevotella sp.]|nr:hypothetical protein [Candidatus Prevotella equi]
MSRTRVIGKISKGKNRVRGVAQLVSKCKDGGSLFQMMLKTYVFSGFGGLWSLFPAYDFHNVTPMSHQNSATFVLLARIMRIQGYVTPTFLCKYR